MQPIRLNILVTCTIFKKLMHRIETENIESGPKIVSTGMELIEHIEGMPRLLKIEYLRAAIKEVALSTVQEGRPAAAANVILNNERLLSDIVEILIDASKGRFDVNKEDDVGSVGCFDAIRECLQRSDKPL